VVDEVADILRGLDQTLVAPEALPAFRKYVSARMLRRKATLGWEPRKPVAGDDDELALERPIVLGAMGDVARDAATLREAEAYAKKWLADPKSVSSDAAAIAVPLASIEKGAERFAELREMARTAQTPQDRKLAIGSMAAFDDAATLRQALEWTLTSEIKISEMNLVFGGIATRRRSRDVFYAWAKDNWSRITARLPGSLANGVMAEAAGGACTRETRDDAMAFFLPKAKEVPGAKRPLDVSLEIAGLCVAQRERDAALVTSWLSAH
jgi:hypothetical protein